jgi:hypothetical protein
MAMRWTLSDIPWSEFDASKVDADILRIVKAASMVEYNGADYAAYLCNVFSGDPQFQKVAKVWADEEIQHGQALAQWARRADPSFDFDARFKRFTEGYRIPVEAERSVRGSRSGELVARCIVEVGTSSYYSALADAVREPVLRHICRRIAADELRHYKLFYGHLKRYLVQERIGRLRRIFVAAGRIGESEDDELAYAYYAANAEGEPYDRKSYAKAHLSRALMCYRPDHMRRAVAMIFKAAGLKPNGLLARWASAVSYWFVKRRAGTLKELSAAR